MINEVIMSTGTSAMASSLAPSAIRPAVQEEKKLDRFERAVAGTSRSMVPIKPFVKVRWKSIAEQLAGRSQGEHIN